MATALWVERWTPLLQSKYFQIKTVELSNMLLYHRIAPPPQKKKKICF